MLPKWISQQTDLGTMQLHAFNWRYELPSNITQSKTLGGSGSGNNLEESTYQSLQDILDHNKLYLDWNPNHEIPANFCKKHFICYQDLHCTFPSFKVSKQLPNKFDQEPTIRITLLPYWCQFVIQQMTTYGCMVGGGVSELILPSSCPPRELS